MFQIENIIPIMIVVFGLWILQGFFSFFQMRNYQSALARLKKEGRLLIARQKGKLREGIIMIMAIDKKGIIVAAEQMRGITVFSKFKPLDSVIGQSIYDENQLLNSVESQVQKKAIIKALEGVHNASDETL